MRGANSAGSEHNLLALHHKYLTVALDLHADSLLSLEDNAPSQDVAPDGQIQTVLHRVQVGEGGTHANALRVVHRDKAETVGARAVHVLHLTEPGGGARLVKGRLDGQGRFAIATQYRHRAISTVEVVANILVRFQSSEKWQDVQVAPLVVAPGSPVIVVFGQAPQKELAVDGPGTADNFAFGDVDLTLDRVDNSAHCPVVGRAIGLAVAGLAELKVIG